MKSRVVFICGPYRGENAWQVEQNIRVAEETALEVWKLGFPCICPHTNTRHFQGAAPDETWLHGYLEILNRCDILIKLNGWQKSNGSIAEVDFATWNKIEVYDSVEAFKYAYNF